jgi:hypothetical protein
MGADIRRPIRITPSECGILVSCEIIDQFDRDVSGFSTRTIRPIPVPVKSQWEDGMPYAELDWKHFDPGYGVKLRIVYVANSLDIGARPKIAGTLVTGTPILSEQPGPFTDDHEGRSYFFFVGLFAVMVISLLALLVIARLNADTRDAAPDSFLVVAVLGVLIVLYLCALGYRRNIGPRPPFPVSRTDEDFRKTSLPSRRSSTLIQSLQSPTSHAWPRACSMSACCEASTHHTPRWNSPEVRGQM